MTQSHHTIVDAFGVGAGPRPRPVRSRNPGRGRGPAPTLLAALLLACGAAFAADKEITPEAAAVFEEDIKPILEETCQKCHGGEAEIKGGLRLTSRGGLLKGGDRGPVVNFDEPASSLLLDMISWSDKDHQMPPSGKMQAWDLDAFKEWIELGAPWPGSPENEAPALLHGFTKQSPELWAFRPVQRTEPPKVDDPRWSQNPIDAFIYAKLRDAGLKPGPPASKEQLVRRLYYDLTGLPPALDEVAAFVSDPDPAAYEKVADRLLASPRYGEKWGRHWLDLVHYADSNGYERDSNKPFIWRYRDYVIDAFNADKPYTEFVTQQLAGDEMDNPGAEDLIATGYYRLGLWDDEPADPLLARYDGLDDMVDTTSRVFLGLTMGCCRCHEHKLDPLPQSDYYRMLSFFQGIKPMERTDGNGILRSILPADEQRIYDEKVEQKRQDEWKLTGEQQELVEAFKVGLAKKLPEAVKDKDLKTPDLEDLTYRFYRDSWETLPDFDMLKPEDKGRLERGFITTAPATRPDAIGFVYEGQLRVQLDGDYVFAVEALGGVRLLVNGEEVFARREPGAPRGEGTVSLKAGPVPIRLEYFVKRGPPRLKVAWAPLNANFRESLSAEAGAGLDDKELRLLIAQHGREILGVKKAARLDELTRSREEVRARAIEGKFAAVAIETGREPMPTHILIRGNVYAEGKEVLPGFPEILGTPDPASPSPYARDDSSGRRRQLAEWIADPANPLPARVMVNRLWQHHFGRGIVESSNNFGAIGDRPTHPELLDWLASEFVRGGWRIKAMHRLMVTSETYKMSSASNGAALAKDPQNKLLWRFNMRRLTAEEVRDSVLAGAGTLNLEMHGPGVYPKLPQEVILTSSMNKNLTESGTWGTSTPEQAARRSIYVQVKRSLLLPILTDFDLAETDASCPVRFSTTQPTQALGMLNSEFVHEQAAQLAARLRREAAEPAAQVRRGFEIVTSRPARDEDMARGLQFLDEMQAQEGLSAEKALDRFSLLLLNLNEFVYVD